MSLAVSRGQLKAAANKYVATSSNTDGAILEFFDSLDTDLARQAKSLYQSGNHVGLLDLDINPQDYVELGADMFHRDYLAVSFLSKSTFLKTGYDLKDRAIMKFKKMELHCSETNRRFKSDNELENSEFALLLFTMRRKIDLILGEFNIEEFFDKSSWGPGVTTLLKGSDTSATRKFQSEIGITRDAYSLLGSSLGSAYPNWFREEHVSDSSFQYMDGNSVTTVPKNSKTDRVIAVEPGINLFFQKGIGKMLKARLKRFGIDLSTQQRNQKAACEGSITGALATIDFSSASDTIAKNVVRHLLPSRWLTVLDHLRCRHGKIGNESFQWEKFSSMGNGFTFELETLIFFAAALACCEHGGVDATDVTVYGDDVVIPTSVTKSFIELSHFLGFIVNEDKSFISGPFRESCGEHFFNGYPVKPIFLKDKLHNAISVYKLANSIRRLSHLRNLGHGCDIRFLATWHHILKRLPNSLRAVRISEGFGDGGIISNWDESSPVRSKDGHEGYETISLNLRSVKLDTECLGLLNERLTQIKGCYQLLRRPSPLNLKTEALHLKNADLETQGYGNTVSLRGQTRLGCETLRVFKWYNLGPWC
jgi:hypothetical protein